MFPPTATFGSAAQETKASNRVQLVSQHRVVDTPAKLSPSHLAVCDKLSLEKGHLSPGANRHGTGIVKG